MYDIQHVEADKNGVRVREPRAKEGGGGIESIFMIIWGGV